MTSGRQQTTKFNITFHFNRLSDFVKIGSGTYGDVYKARIKPTKAPVAVKVKHQLCHKGVVHKLNLSLSTHRQMLRLDDAEYFKHNDPNDGMPVSVVRELTVLKAISHENIVACLGFGMFTNQRSHTNIFIVMECASTSLYEFMAARKQSKIPIHITEATVRQQHVTSSNTRVVTSRLCISALHQTDTVRSVAPPQQRLLSPRLKAPQHTGIR